MNIIEVLVSLIAFSVILNFNQPISANNTEFNITEKNSKFNPTKAIQTKINSVSKNGGSKINITAGTYNVKYLDLKGNVEIHLSAGSKIIFSNKFCDFPAISTRYEGQNVKMRDAYYLW